MAVLFIVHAAGKIRMGDLAGKLQVAPRTVTDFVDGLERDGFLHRLADPKDRRAFLLELTTSARADFDKIVGMRKAFVDEIFSPLSDDEKIALAALLRKLREGPLSELAQSREDAHDHAHDLAHELRHRHGRMHERGPERGPDREQE